MKVAPATSLRVVIIWSCVQLIQTTVLRRRHHHRGTSIDQARSRPPHLHMAEQPFAPVPAISRPQDMIEKRRRMSHLENLPIRVENFYPIVERAKFRSIRRHVGEVSSSNETVSTSGSSTEQSSKGKHLTLKSKENDAKKHLLLSQSNDESDTDGGVEIPNLNSPNARRIDIYKKQKFGSKETTDYVRRFSVADRDAYTSGLEPRGYDLGIPFKRVVLQKKPRIPEPKIDYLHLNRLKNTAHWSLNQTSNKPLTKITSNIERNFEIKNQKEITNLPKDNVILSKRMSQLKESSETSGRDEKTYNLNFISSLSRDNKKLNSRRRMSETQEDENIPNRKTENIEATSSPNLRRPEIKEDEVNKRNLQRGTEIKKGKLNPLSFLSEYEETILHESLMKKSEEIPRHGKLNMTVTKNDKSNLHEIDRNKIKISARQYMTETEKNKFIPNQSLHLPKSEEEHYMTLQSSSVKKQLSQIETSKEIPNPESHIISKNKKLDLSSSHELKKRNIEKVEVISSAEWQSVEKAEVISSDDNHEIETKEAKFMSKQNELPTLQIEKFDGKPSHETRMSKIENYQNPKREFVAYKNVNVMTNHRSRFSEAKKENPTSSLELDLSDTEKFVAMPKQKLTMSASRRFIASEKQKKHKGDRNLLVLESKNKSQVSENQLNQAKLKTRIEQSKEKTLNKKPNYNMSALEEKFNKDLKFKVLVSEPEIVELEVKNEAVNPENKNFRAMQNYDLQEQKSVTLNSETSQTEKTKIQPNNAFVSQTSKFKTTQNDETQTSQTEKNNLGASDEQESLETRNRELRLLEHFKAMPDLESLIPEKEKVKPVLNNGLRVSETDKFPTESDNKISAPLTYKFNVGANLEVYVTTMRNHDVHVPKSENDKALSNHMLRDQKIEILDTKSNRDLRMKGKEKVNATLNNVLHALDSDLLESMIYVPQKKTLKLMSNPELRQENNELLDVK